ncbi:MAG: hypothetical protein AB7V48_16260 [Sedimentibacter sp.]
MKRIIKIAIAALPLMGAASMAKASDYGCEALLCFAGGKNVSECQPTIKRVLKDLAKGKGFPHCSFVNFNGSTGSSEGMVSTRLYTERTNSRTCRDGQTKATRSFMGYYCKTIEINIDPKFAASPDHQKQYFNY